MPIIWVPAEACPGARCHFYYPILLKMDYLCTGQTDVTLGKRLKSTEQGYPFSAGYTITPTFSMDFLVFKHSTQEKINHQLTHTSPS